jgi:hypothetical protein
MTLRAWRGAETWIRTLPGRVWSPVYEGWTGRQYTGVARTRARVFAEYAPAFERISQRLDDATDLMRHGRGLVSTVGRVAGPIAFASDVNTGFISGSNYDGARATADVWISRASALGTAYLFLAPAAPGLLAVLPVVAGAAVIAGVAWGVTNLAIDAWPGIREGMQDLGDSIRSGMGRFLGIGT